MSPSHTRKGQKLYRYYVSQSVIKDGARQDRQLSRVPAGEVERAVVDQLRILLRSSEIIVATWRAARKRAVDISEVDVREALNGFDGLWDELFPVEQARVVRLLVERVDVGLSGIDIGLRTEGLVNLVTDLRVHPAREAA